jgi:predicted nucleotidyltransferase
MAASQVVAGRAELAEFCRAHHVKRLSLFGSVLSEHFRPDSDVDVLVEFEAGYTPGLIGLGTMEAELSPLFGGRRIDLHTPASISEHFREHVLSTAEVQFAREVR